MGETSDAETLDRDASSTVMPRGLSSLPCANHLTDVGFRGPLVAVRPAGNLILETMPASAMIELDGPPRHLPFEGVSVEVVAPRSRHQYSNWLVVEAPHDREPGNTPWGDPSGFTVTTPLENGEASTVAPPSMSIRSSSRIIVHLSTRGPRGLVGSCSRPWNPLDRLRPQARFGSLHPRHPIFASPSWNLPPVARLGGSGAMGWVLFDWTLAR